MSLSRLQKHHILAQRENIFKEMSSLNSSIKDSNEHLKTDYLKHFLFLIDFLHSH